MTSFTCAKKNSENIGKPTSYKGYELKAKKKTFKTEQRKAFFLFMIKLYTLP